MFSAVSVVGQLGALRCIVCRVTMKRYDEEWARRKRYLIRSLFQDPPALSPVREESPARAPPSPLPPLIVEVAPDPHDHPPRHYTRLHRRVLKVYRRLFIEGRSDISSLLDDDVTLPLLDDDTHEASDDCRKENYDESRNLGKDIQPDASERASLSDASDWARWVSVAVAADVHSERARVELGGTDLEERAGPAPPPPPPAPDVTRSPRAPLASSSPLRAPHTPPHSEDFTHHLLTSLHDEPSFSFHDINCSTPIQQLTPGSLSPSLSDKRNKRKRDCDSCSGRKRQKLETAPSSGVLSETRKTSSDDSFHSKSLENVSRHSSRCVTGNSANKRKSQDISPSFSNVRRKTRTDDSQSSGSEYVECSHRSVQVDYGDIVRKLLRDGLFVGTPVVYTLGARSDHNL